MKNKVNKTNLYKEFTNKLVSATRDYGNNQIGIVMDTEMDCAYLSYHSHNNSFNVSEDYPIDSLDFIKIADDFDIGWSEI